MLRTHRDEKPTEQPSRLAWRVVRDDELCRREFFGRRRGEIGRCKTFFVAFLGVARKYTQFQLSFLVISRVFLRHTPDQGFNKIYQQKD